MDRFWSYGYQATSIQDLVDNMGINRGSLYGTYRGKEALFETALACYMKQVISGFIDILENSEEGLGSIERVLNTLAEAIRFDPEKRGCFLTNTAVGLVPEDRALRRKVVTYFKRIEAAFECALKRAQSRGEIKASANVYALSWYLISSVQGLLVMRKVISDEDVLKDVVSITMSALR